MTDEDIREMVRNLKSFISSELETLHARMDSMESGMMNELKSHGRRIARLEEFIK